MRVARPMIVMLIAGFAFGFACSGLSWSSSLDRCLKGHAEWKEIVDKQRVAMDDQSNTIKMQSDVLKRLTAASDDLLDAIKSR